jgi:hypothetical protein
MIPPAGPTPVGPTRVGPTLVGSDQVLLVPPSPDLSCADPRHAALLRRQERDSARPIDAALGARVPAPCLQRPAAAGAHARGMGIAITSMSGVPRDAVRDPGPGSPLGAAALDIQPHGIGER